MCVPGLLWREHSRDQYALNTIEDEEQDEGKQTENQEEKRVND